MKFSYLILAVLLLTGYRSYAQNTYPWPSTGPIGIGISLPKTGLHLFGANQTTSTLSTSSGLNGALYIQDSGGSAGNGGTLLFGVSQGAFAALKGLGTNGDGNTTGDLAFSTRNTSTDATLTERMRIRANGNIGIGISDPQNALDVNGTIHSKSVLIDLIGWNDYVFKKDYQLRPLSEVKSYIDAHQHLPEIPSEQEMVKNGLDVAEMNKLLMKKVEELTLYLIDLQKQVNELKATKK